MKSWLLALSLALGGVLPVQAETAGRGSRLDARVQTAVYSPDNVYRLYAMKNRASAIQLEAGETINLDSGAMVAGKPDDWKIGANKAGSLILLKPGMYASEPETNVVISTNRRTYLLELKLTPNPGRMTYLLRFDYPRPAKVGETPFRGRDLNVDPCSGGTVNRQYMKRGDLALSPYEVWDNGTFTCLRFPTNAPRPVIYEVLPDGTESMVPGHPVNDIVVLHAVSREFRLRLNRLVLGLYTQRNNTGWYNYNGTTTGEKREVKAHGKP